MAPDSLIFLSVPESCALATAGRARNSTRLQNRFIFVSKERSDAVATNVAGAYHTATIDPLQAFLFETVPPHSLPATPEALGTILRERFPAMSPEFRQAARFLADHPEEVPVSSMRSLAARAGVQPPTLVRFAQSLGFPGWPAMREIYVASFRERREPYAVRAKALVSRQGHDLIQ